MLLWIWLQFLHSYKVINVMWCPELPIWEAGSMCINFIAVFITCCVLRRLTQEIHRKSSESFENEGKYEWGRRAGYCILLPFGTTHRRSFSLATILLFPPFLSRLEHMPAKWESCLRHWDQNKNAWLCSQRWQVSWPVVLWQGRWMFFLALWLKTIIYKAFSSVHVINLVTDASQSYSGTAMYPVNELLPRSVIFVI